MELTAGGSTVVSLGGSYYNLFIAGRSPGSSESFTSDLNRLRLDLDVTPSDSFLIKAIYDNSAIVGTVLDTPGFNVVKEVEEQTLSDLTGTLVDNPDLFWKHSIYRLYARYGDGPATLTVGRQRVAWGQARLWNPTDLFNPVSPLQIEGSQRTGVDAVSFEYSLGALSALHLVYAPGDTSEETSAGVRLRTNFKEYDFSAVAGLFRDSAVIGFDFAGNLASSGLRGEGVYTDPDEDLGEQDFVRLVLSWDYNLSSSLYVLVEYLYNGGNIGTGTGFGGVGADASGAEIAVFSGEIITRNKNFLALDLNYEIASLIRGDLFFIFDIDGGGVLFGPTAVYNVYTNVDWIVGAQVFDSEGEYLGLENSYYTSVQWYF